MIQALIGPIANLAGSFMESKIEQTKAKGRVAQAKAEAEAEVMKVAATHEAGWEKIMAQASDNSWKDEAGTITFILLIVACFITSQQPYISDGFKFLREDCPDWLSYGILASIAASFGLKSIAKLKK